MSAGEGKIEPGVRIELTEAQQKARRKRNMAIGGCLVALILVFYVATIVKIGPGILRAQQQQGQLN